jgi:kinesin family protein 2/24
MLGNEETPGMYLLAAFDIFSKLQPDQTVTVSFYEIYCEKLYDLLNEKVQLNPREDAKGVVNIVGLSEKKISSVDELMEVIESGNGERVTA